MIAVASLALTLTYLAVIFGVRAAIQYRRTGDTGFRGLTGRPRTVTWSGGVLFIAALVTAVASCIVATVNADDSTGTSLVLGCAGLGLMALGFIATLVAQGAMGSSWRVGVAEEESTDLVTDNAFAYARNPVFTSMLLAAVGLPLAVPSVLSALSLVTLFVAIQIQVRLVEEPYLARVHGEQWDEYAARVGRFVPSLGRLSTATAKGRP